VSPSGAQLREPPSTSSTPAALKSREGCVVIPLGLGVEPETRGPIDSEAIHPQKTGGSCWTTGRRRSNSSRSATGAGVDRLVEERRNRRTGVRRVPPVVGRSPRARKRRRHPDRSFRVLGNTERCHVVGDRWACTVLPRVCTPVVGIVDCAEGVVVARSRRELIAGWFSQQPRLRHNHNPTTGVHTEAAAVARPQRSPTTCTARCCRDTKDRSGCLRRCAGSRLSPHHRRYPTHACAPICRSSTGRSTRALGRRSLQFDAALSGGQATAIHRSLRCTPRSHPVLLFRWARTRSRAGDGHSHSRTQGRRSRLVEGELPKAAAPDRTTRHQCRIIRQAVIDAYPGVPQRRGPSSSLLPQSSPTCAR